MSWTLSSSSSVLESSIQKVNTSSQLPSLHNKHYESLVVELEDAYEELLLNILNETNETSSTHDLRRFITSFDLQKLPKSVRPKAQSVVAAALLLPPFTAADCLRSYDLRPRPQPLLDFLSLGVKECRGDVIQRLKNDYQYGKDEGRTQLDLKKLKADYCFEHGSNKCIDEDASMEGTKADEGLGIIWHGEAFVVCVVCVVVYMCCMRVPHMPLCVYIYICYLRYEL